MSLPQFKQTEVGFIPQQWGVKSLGELFDFSGGLAASRDDLSLEGHCYLHYGDIHKSEKTFVDVQQESSEIPRLDIALERVSPKSLLETGDVVFADASEDIEGVGKHTVVVNRENAPFISGLHTIVAKSKNHEMNDDYKKFCFLSENVRKQFSFYAVGAKVSSISRSNIAKIFLPLPPLPEQIEIARILGVWDAAIGDMAQLIAAKNQHKRGLMQQLLTGERRFAEFKGQPFVSCAIGDVLGLRSRLVKWDDEATYRLASVRRNSGGLFWREALRGDQIKVKKLHTVHTGDFLISHIQAAYGAMGCVPDSFDGGHVSDMYSILTPREGVELDIRFVDYLSQTPVMHRHILQSSNGFFAERLRLNFDPLEFLKQRLDLPPTLAEQRRISDVLDAATAEIQLLKKQLDALKTQKRGLMQLLLSGEKSVAVANAGNLDDVTRSNTEGER